MSTYLQTLKDLPLALMAQVYNGPGIIDGVDEAKNIGGISGGSLRELVLAILFEVLSYMALVAVIVIVIAGIYLVFSNGDENVKEKAKKIIIYTIIGLLVILFATAIVWILTKDIPSATTTTP